MSTAFGVQQTAAGIGTTASDMRHILAAQWACTGVVDGLSVTGGTSLAYAVASGVAVCSRGTSDGKTLAWFAGGNSPAVAASDATSPRIDVVWIAAHDAAQGDADNLVTLGVTQGKPAATPVAPTIPTYATQLAQMLMPAGATTTANATSTAGVGYAIPYGSTLGLLLEKVDTSNGVTFSGTRTVVSGSFTLPTDRLVTVNHIFTGCNVSGSFTNGSSVYVHFLLDGVEMHTHEQKTWPNIAASYFTSFSRVIEAGTHTISMTYVSQGDSYREYYSNGGWAGQVIQVVDAGVVR